MTEEIKKFLEDPKSNEVKFQLTSPNNMVRAVESVGGSVDRETMDTNGWQWDWWMDGEYKGRTFTLHGSGYYGNGSIYWKDEEDEDEEE